MSRKKQFQRLNVIRYRSLFLMLLFVSLFGVLLWKLFALQITERVFLKSHGEARTLRLVSMPAKRGMILDRHGKPLAVSTKVQSLWIEPKTFSPTVRQLRQLARLSGIQLDRILAKQKRFKNRAFIYLKRHLSPDIFQQIQNLQIKGVHFKSEYRRFYPAGEINANVLGLTDLDGLGQSGLEVALDPYLKGTSGKKKILRDRLGREIEALERLKSESIGQNITLSLDQRLQYLAYRNLKSTVEKHQAKGGCALILEVGTGEVLAMVNYPSFNPNDRATFNINLHQHNMNVTHVFEPGSTMKAFSIASALEQDHITPQTQVNTAPGIWRVGQHYVRDLKNYGMLDVSGVARHSSNVGVAKLALGLPEGALWNTYQRFGFGQVTESGFPGEQSGLVLKATQQRGHGLAAMAFGYGIAVTPLQLAKAYATLGSNGVAYPVTFFKASAPPKGKQVISPQIAQQVRAMLRRVVEEGGGRKARVFGYQISGKTGTARKVLKTGYSANHHIAIFAGLAPAISPRFSIVVVLDDPKQGGYYSSVVAAPFFSKIASAALRLYNVPMDLLSTQGVQVASIH